MQPDEYHDEKQAEPGAMTPLDPNQVNVLRIRFALAAAAFALAAFAPDIGPLRNHAAAARRAGRHPVVRVDRHPITPGRRYRRWGYKEGEEEIEIGRGMLIPGAGRPCRRAGPAYRRVLKGRSSALSAATSILHTAGMQGAAVPLPGLLTPTPRRWRDREARQDQVGSRCSVNDAALGAQARVLPPGDFFGRPVAQDRAADAGRRRGLGVAGAARGLGRFFPPRSR